MEIKLSVAKFLKLRLTMHKLKLIELSRKSGIPYQTINNLIQGVKQNPDLSTLIKLADFFNCSIDEISGRDNKYFHYDTCNIYFQNIEIDQISQNLKSFIFVKLNQLNIAPSRLSMSIGFNNELISNFIRTPPKIKMLSTPAILALADYFGISIDEMIGRSSSILRMDEDPKNNSN